MTKDGFLDFKLLYLLCVGVEENIVYGVNLLVRVPFTSAFGVLDQNSPDAGI